MTPEPIPNLAKGQTLTVDDIIDAVNELRGVGRDLDAEVARLLGGDQ